MIKYECIINCKAHHRNFNTTNKLKKKKIRKKVPWSSSILPFQKIRTIPHLLSKLEIRQTALNRLSWLTRSPRMSRKIEIENIIKKKNLILAFLQWRGTFSFEISFIISRGPKKKLRWWKMAVRDKVYFPSIGRFYRY